MHYLPFNNKPGKVEHILTDYQCDQIWPIFANLANFLKSLGNFMDGLFSIWQTFVPTLAFFATGQIFIIVNSQRLNSNIAIWSHCRLPTYLALSYIHSFTHTFMNIDSLSLSLSPKHTQSIFLYFTYYTLSIIQISVTRKNHQMSVKVAQK